MAWKTLTSNTVYENPWIRVDHREVLNPSGEPGIYGVVHFKGRAVGVVALDDQGYIWLVGQTRYTLDSYCWEIPEGGVPAEEDLLEGAKRELLEETGITAQHWQPLLQLHTSNSITDEVAQVYLATGLSQGEADPESTEDITAERIHLDEAIERVMSGEITDAITVAALLAADRVIGKS